ncbi:pH-response regulator protein palA/rim20 [Tulasnella sp. 408]|nr:pH-response regulator protein palA/rim20 [Tulasnella sp. 408]
MAAMDDIRRRIELEASAMERWVEVKPAMFEDTITSELEKYDKYHAQLEEGGRKQAALLKKIETANTKFIDSRKRDPSVEQREQALATLYTAFNEYHKTIGDLSQGLEFYNKLSVVTTQLAENCRVWAAERDAEVKRVHEALRQAAAAPAVATAAQQDTSVIAPPPEPAQVQHERADVVMTSPRGQPSPSLPISVTSPTPSTRTFKPKSKFVQNALGSRATPATPSAPTPTAGPSSGSLPSPWKAAVYARELNAADADWEDEEARNVSPTKPIAHELGNLNDSEDWDDGPVLPSPVASTPQKGSGKKAGNSNRSLNSTDRTPSGKTKTRSGRVPAT